MWVCNQFTTFWATDQVFNRLLLSQHAENEAAGRKPGLRPVRVFDHTDKWNVETTQPDQTNEPVGAGLFVTYFFYVRVHFVTQLTSLVASSGRRVWYAPYLGVTQIYCLTQVECFHF